MPAPLIVAAGIQKGVEMMANRSQAKNAELAAEHEADMEERRAENAQAERVQAAMSDPNLSDERVAAIRDEARQARDAKVHAVKAEQRGKTTRLALGIGGAAVMGVGLFYGIHSCGGPVHVGVDTHVTANVGAGLTEVHLADTRIVLDGKGTGDGEITVSESIGASVFGVPIIPNVTIPNGIIGSHAHVNVRSEEQIVVRPGMELVAVEDKQTGEWETIVELPPSAVSTQEVGPGQASPESGASVGLFNNYAQIFGVDKSAESDAYKAAAGAADVSFRKNADDAMLADPRVLAAAVMTDVRKDIETVEQGLPEGPAKEGLKALEKGKFKLMFKDSNGNFMTPEDAMKQYSRPVFNPTKVVKVGNIVANVSVDKGIAPNQATISTGVAMSFNDIINLPNQELLEQAPPELAQAVGASPEPSASASTSSDAK